MGRIPSSLLLLASLAPAWAAAGEQTKPAESAAAKQVQSTAAQQVTVKASTKPDPGTSKPDPNEVQSAMAVSIAKQRVSLIQQVAAAMGKKPIPSASFFTVPWVETPVPFSLPPCDPIPPAELDKLILENSQQLGVKEDLIRGVIQEESGARPCAVSWKGAQGLMQLMPATAEQFGVKDPFDPHQNVEAGTKLLKQLLTKYKDDVSLALAAYNAGEGAVDSAGGVPPIPETQKYVNDIGPKLPKN
ncbi:MAG TPA: lytic transglycosylase domain-containing protein [Bryobacteraceae bacterium]|nr:lytic transglycosylase domain-containing protein [Bryobacteraceae bacterium]